MIKVRRIVEKVFKVSPIIPEKLRPGKQVPGNCCDKKLIKNYILNQRFLVL